jgi:hypothetical protein
MTTLVRWPPARDKLARQPEMRRLVKDSCWLAR